MVVFQMLASFYIKYVQIFRNLEAAYDQIVHPQKRLIIRQVLDGVMGRILELKNEMVQLEFSEFHYFDDILQDLKLAPVRILNTKISEKRLFYFNSYALATTVLTRATQCFISVKAKC